MLKAGQQQTTRNEHRPARGMQKHSSEYSAEQGTGWDIPVCPGPSASGPPMPLSHCPSQTINPSPKPGTRSRTHWDWDTLGLVHSGTGTQRGWYAMGLGHNGTGTLGLGHNGTGTHWDWFTKGLVHNGTGTLWDWDTMGLGHTGPGSQRGWYTLGLGHNGTGTQWDWYTMGPGITGPDTKWDCGTMGWYTIPGAWWDKGTAGQGAMDLGHCGLVDWGKNGLGTVTSHRRTGANVKGDILFQAVRKQIRDQQMMIQINEI